MSWRRLHGFLLPYLGVYGPLGRVGPKYLPGRARLAAPVLAVRPPGGTTQGPSGTTAADAQAAINSLPAGPLTRAPACLLPGSGVLRLDPDCASSSAFSGVNPAGRVIGWLRSQGFEKGDMHPVLLRSQLL